MVTVDLFAGPGGWDRAAESLGLRPIGIEKDEWACSTRAAAGLLTIRADVTQLEPRSFAPVEGLIASPPCPDFSVAGRRAGIEGETGRLMFEVPRWAVALRPKWIACEQVPPALPWWESFARDLRHIGYKTWTGILCAADYGTPQTRTRAFLLARLDRQPLPPGPSHAKHPQPDLFGNVPERWVSMADVLGWDSDVIVEGVQFGERRKRRGTEPFFTVQAAPGRSAGRWRVMLDRRQTGAPVVDVSENPCPTITATMFGKGVAKVWAEVTVNGRSGRRRARSSEPSPTVTSRAQWDAGWTEEGEGLTSFSQKAIRVTLPELGLLQDFPRDYPWQGNKSQQSQQVGNCVPIRLAKAVLASVVGD